MYVCMYVCIYVRVAVLGRNQTLFHCVFQLCYCIRSTVAQNSGVARTQPMPGHSVGTLRLRTQAPPSFKPLAARNAEATRGGSGGCSPVTFWNF